MALNAGVACGDVIQSGGIDDIRAGGMREMFAAWAVAAFAADIPFGNLFGVDVVSDGVATIAERAGGAAGIVGRVVGDPPIGAIGNVVFAPLMIFDFPLRAEGEVVVADFGEVVLLPKAAVN